MPSVASLDIDTIISADENRTETVIEGYLFQNISYEGMLLKSPMN